MNQSLDGYIDQPLQQFQRIEGEVRRPICPLAPKHGSRSPPSPPSSATPRKPQMDAPIDGREQPVQLLVCRRQPERVKAQGPALVFDITAPPKGPTL